MGTVTLSLKTITHLLPVVPRDRVTVPIAQTHERASHRQEPHVLYALGLTLRPTRISIQIGCSGICRVAFAFPATYASFSASQQYFWTPFLNLADSRPGQTQRARNYTADNP